MLSNPILGSFSALFSAVIFGAADFSGGLATRRSHQFQVLFLSTVASLILLVIFTLLWRESLPSTGSLVWAVLAGGAGSIGLASLYKALSIGPAAIVAPTAGVIGATLPVFIGSLTQGVLAPTHYLGFVFAFGGIWLVTATSSGVNDRSGSGLTLAVFAGIAFGGFFIFISRIESESVFAPLMIAKLVSVLMALVLLLFVRQKFPSLADNPIALLAGVLDATANIFFFLATNLTRLDIAAVLASLYPAVTVLLAHGIQKEQVTILQWAGVALCLVAIALNVP